jgi:predicted membrane metal-binding protein
MKAVLLGLALMAVVRPENALPVLLVLGVLAGFVLLTGFSFDTLETWRPTARWFAHRRDRHVKSD